MTDKEKIIQEIERLKREIPYHENAWSALDKVLDFINALPVKQTSDDLKKAAEENLPNAPYSVKQDNLGGHVGVYGQCQMLDMFKLGANWQKEQLMKGLCYETKVYRDEEGDGIDTPIESWLALENNEITNLPNIG